MAAIVAGDSLFGVFAGVLFPPLLLLLLPCLEWAAWPLLLPLVALVGVEKLPCCGFGFSEGGGGEEAVRRYLPSTPLGEASASFSPILKTGKRERDSVIINPLTEFPSHASDLGRPPFLPYLPFPVSHLLTVLVLSDLTTIFVSSTGTSSRRGGIRATKLSSHTRTRRTSFPLLFFLLRLKKQRLSD